MCSHYFSSCDSFTHPFKSNDIKIVWVDTFGPLSRVLKIVENDRIDLDVGNSL